MMAPDPADAADQLVGERSAPDEITEMLQRVRDLQTIDEVVDFLHAACREMGGTLVPARDAGPDVLPLDVSLGEGLPLLVSADPMSPAWMQLERLLPRLVEGASRTVDQLRYTDRAIASMSRDEIRFSLRYERGTQVLTMVGELDTTTAPILCGWVGDTAGIASAVEIDIAALDFIDAAGIGAVLSVIRCFGSLGTDVRLKGANDRTRRLFGICGVDHLLDPIPSQRSASGFSSQGAG